MNKKFIFGLLSNQCDRGLAGTIAQITSIQRYPIFGHQRVVEISIKSSQTPLLNIFNDGRIILCSTVIIQRYSDHDKGACKRYTLIQKIIGPGNIFSHITKWLCYKLLTTTDRKLQTIRRLKLMLSSKFLKKGVWGIASLPRSSSFTHSGWQHKN